MMQQKWFGFEKGVKVNICHSLFFKMHPTCKGVTIIDNQPCYSMELIIYGLGAHLPLPYASAKLPDYGYTGNFGPNTASWEDLQTDQCFSTSLMSRSISPGYF